MWSFQDQMASKKIHIFDKNLFKILCKIVAQLMTTMQESNKKSKIMQQLCKNVAWFLNIIFENLVYISNIGSPRENQRWNKLDSSMLKSKNQVTLFVNYSYNSFYDFRFSENTYSEQKVMCQNMGFLNLYGGYIWTYL